MSNKKLSNERWGMIHRAIVGFFALLVLILIGYLVITQLTMESEELTRNSYQSMNESWVLQYENGDSVIDLPAKLSKEYGDELVIENTLPDNMDGFNSLLVWNYGKNIEVSIDGEVIYTFDMYAIDAIGVDRPYLYHFVPMKESYAGKPITIRMINNQADDQGKIGEIYVGEKASLLLKTVSTYQLEIVSAIFMLFLGIICFLGSFMFRYINRRVEPIGFLGIAVALAALWILANSRVRQFIFPNVSSARNIAFMVVSLGVFAFALYLNGVQRGRYKNVFLVLNIISIINFTAIFILHLSGVFGLSQMFISTVIIVAISVIVFLVTIIIDVIKRQVANYRMAAIGILVLALSALVQIIIYKLSDSAGLGGIVLVIGLFILVICAIINAVISYGGLQRDRKLAYQQIQVLSVEAMKTMARAVDAKDPYTSQHSTRVSEYSALLAKELGWSKSDVENIRYAALMHDIGKIGVPDNVLNKPSKLTDTEFEVIKSHTTIGGEILKNIESVKDADLVAQYHHERYDGKGYPEGLSGEEIPKIARLVGIADAYDAMNSKRVYRKELPADVIRSELVKGRGTQFDPEMLDVFMQMLDEGKLEIKLEERRKSPDDVDLNNLMVKFIQTATEEEHKHDNTDFLTGLLTRTVGERSIIEAIGEDEGVLAFIDLDNLKQINDMYGHSAGDNAIREVGVILQEYKGDDICCRLGGDEFLYFFKGATQAEAEEKVKKIIEAFNAVCEKNAVLKIGSLSIGLCTTTMADTYQDVYIKADKALYHVKQNGKSDYYFYNNQMLELPTKSIDLRALVETLNNTREYRGALGIEYREFEKVYRYIMNIKRRNKLDLHLAMITLEPTTVPDKLFMDDIEHAMSCMKDSITSVLRTADVCTRYTSLQFLVIFVGTQSKHIDKIMKRIFVDYYKRYGLNKLQPEYDAVEMKEVLEEHN